MNTDIYNISNSKIICRLLPFFARGRKMILFLEAVSTPLIKLHNSFLQWAYEQIVKVKITFQTSVMIWYLNYKFSNLFVNIHDSFEVIQDQETAHFILFNKNESEIIEILGTRVTNTDEDTYELISKPIKDAGSPDPNLITIVAPAINTTEDYTEKQYKFDINEIISKYKTSFVKYQIVINQTL